MNGSIIFGEISQEEIHIDSRELSARLGGYCTACHGIADPFIADITNAMSTKYSARVCEVKHISADTVEIYGVRFTSSALARALSGANIAYVMAVTLGSEVDRYLRKKEALSPSAHYIADAVASAIAEATCDAAQKRLPSECHGAPRFSVGYADLSLFYQRDVLKIIDGARIGISLTDSYLMLPTKSITAIIGIKNEEKANNT